MRIDGFQSIPAVLQTFKSDKSKSILPEPSNSQSSSVSFSSFAEVFQSIHREVLKQEAAQNAKVEQLSQLVQTGKFAIDANKLAARLIDMKIIDL